MQMQPMPIDRNAIHHSVGDFSMGPRPLGPMIIRYTSSTLTTIDGVDDTRRGGIQGASPGSFAVCVHWCSHRAIAYGLASGGTIHLINIPPRAPSLTNVDSTSCYKPQRCTLSHTFTIHLFNTPSHPLPSQPTFSTHLLTPFPLNPPSHPLSSQVYYLSQ